MKNLAPGIKSSEFIGLAAYLVYMILSGTGLIEPGGHADIVKGFEKAPDAIAAVIQLVQNFGEQTLVGGLLWAYIKRRSALKNNQIKVDVIQAQAQLEKYRALYVQQPK
jgi:hypothetical protein